MIHILLLLLIFCWRYYKVLSNDSDYIGVASSYDLRKYQKKHNIIIVADEESANFI